MVVLNDKCSNGDYSKTSSSGSNRIVMVGKIFSDCDNKSTIVNSKNSIVISLIYRRYLVDIV